jgi:hypothetical protein
MSERVPTVFTFYGYMSNGKRGGRGYTTRANSLNDALDDLERVEGDVENEYLGPMRSFCWRRASRTTQEDA